MPEVNIQYQDSSGNWRTISVTIYNSSFILNEMNRVQKNYPSSRIRAVDLSGRIVDIL